MTELEQTIISRPKADTTARPAAPSRVEGGQTQPEDTDDPGTPGTDPAATEEPTPDDDGGDSKLRRESARYRRQLRDTEGERDALRGRVEAMQRTDIERIAGKDLAVASDLWLATSLPDLLDDEGNVDQTKVSEATAKILTDRPGLRRAAPVDFDGGPRSSVPAPGPSWGELFKGR